eukprot:TRINITY_DN122172_c0_g1_i1.p1 TRINITY_DN122172_c0_g1~~TRINITY_DN122172_c0_g1_i1.p1  ORF type:complete len:476 (+),score=98.44 TRINITY_DN122172_c0_g1_i1:41-1429(+)
MAKRPLLGCFLAAFLVACSFRRNETQEQASLFRDSGRCWSGLSGWQPLRGVAAGRCVGRGRVCRAAGRFDAASFPSYDEDFLEAMEGLVSRSIRAIQTKDEAARHRAMDDVTEALALLQDEDCLDESTKTFLHNMLDILERHGSKGDFQKVPGKIDHLPGNFAKILQEMQAVSSPPPSSQQSTSTSSGGSGGSERRQEPKQQHATGSPRSGHAAVASSDAGADDSLYQTLGISRSASRADIKRAFRALALQHHPDVSDDADAASTFQQISEAYDILVDAESRAAYDREGLEGIRRQGSSVARGKAEMFWEEFKPAKRAGNPRKWQARDNAVAGETSNGEIKVGSVVEFPLREHEVEGKRTHGVGVVLGRNEDRGDVDRLDPSLRSICEVEILWQPEDDDFLPPGSWTPDDLQGPAFPRQEDLRLVRATYVRGRGVGKPEHWILEEELSEYAGSPDGFVGSMV